MFIVDSLNPLKVLAIATTPSESYINAKINSRVLSVIDSYRSSVDRELLLSKRNEFCVKCKANEIINGTSEFVNLSKKMS